MSRARVTTSRHPSSFRSTGRRPDRSARLIEAGNLQKSFGKVMAVRDVSLRAQDGKITGLLGPNGAGKSTTLRLLYTVLKPDAGDALVDGVSAVREPLEARRHMGV